MERILLNKVEDAVRFSGGGAMAIYELELLGIDTSNLHTEEELQDLGSQAILNQDYGLAKHIIDALEEGYLNNDTIYVWNEACGEYDTIEILDTPDDLIEYLDNEL